MNIIGFMNDLANRTTIEQLRVFAAVAEHEHVTRAAEALQMSQPAVSHQLRRLEATLRIRLFERVGRGVKLSGDGRALLPTVTAALTAISVVHEAATARRGLMSGSLSLAASNTIGIYKLPTWLAGYVESVPAVDVRVRLVNTLEAITLVREAQVDCALIEGPGRTGDLEHLTIEVDELVVVASSDHPLAGLKVVRTADLSRHRYIAREPGSGTEALAAEMLGAAYRRGRVLELGQVDAVRAAALAGLGYAVISLAAVREDLRLERLRQLNVGRRTLSRSLEALRRHSSLSPALEAFWTHLASLAAGR